MQNRHGIPTAADIHEGAVYYEGQLFTPKAVLAAVAAGRFSVIGEDRQMHNAFAGAHASTVYFVEQDFADCEELSVVYLVASGQHDPGETADFWIEAHLWGGADDFCWRAEVNGTDVSDWERIN